MQTKAKSNSVITTGLDNEDIVFAVKDAGTVRLHLSALSEAVRKRAMIHGLIQRVSDAAALSRDSATGRAASPADKLAAMVKFIDHYNSGSEEWSPAREASGPGLDSILLAAVGEATGKESAIVRAMVEAGATKHGVTQRVYLARLGDSPLVKPIVERMRAALVPDVDADADLQALIDAE